MSVLANIVRVYTATTGTGTVTLGAAVPSFLTFAQGNIANGNVVTYAILDGLNREIGYGTYTSSGTTMSRDTVLASTNSGSKISLTGAAQVFITPASEDILQTALLSARIFVGNGSNIATGVALSGAGSITNAGVLSINVGAGASITGILPLANGGTSGNLTASNGGIVYSSGSAMAILAGTATAGQIVRSGSSTTPSWSTATYPATTAAGQVLASASANVIAGTATPVLGTAGSVVGTLGFANATSGSITISPVAGALGTVTLTLPAATDTVAVLAASQAFTNKTYNGLTITSTTGTFTVTNGKTLSVSNSLTLAGTDSTTMTFPATSSTVLTTGNTATITKGFAVTPYNAGTFNGTTYTPDPANGNYQYMTITGTPTLAVPGSDCAIDVLATNASATGLTISGSYTYAAASTAAYNATGTNKFMISIRRINSVSTLTITALQ